MRKLITTLLLCPLIATAQMYGPPAQPASSVAITGGTINGATIGATTPAAGSFTTLTQTGTSTQTVTDTAATSGNVNFADGEYHVNAAGASTAVYSGGLSNCYTDATSAAISTPGHTICNFGYNHVNRSQNLAIATEGKMIIDVTGVTLDSGASVHAGLADIASGSTITNMTLLNSVVTANHGTISTLKGADFGITASALIGNVFAYNAQDVSTSIATNYGAWRCQVTANTAHFCLYEDGTAQNAIMGNTYIGATADNGTSAKLQVTGTASFSSSMFFQKKTATGTAPGATLIREEWVCGTNAGTVKKIAYAGTSATAVTIIDNVGAGVTGC